MARTKGALGKSSEPARKAIALFVEGNTWRLQAWLDQIAEGIPMMDREGTQCVDKNGCPLWIQAPDPFKAAQTFQSLVEYHIPKLARTEHSGPDGGALVVQVTSYAPK